MSGSSEARTEPPSPEKLRRAREEGQVGQSRDLVRAAAVGGGATALALHAPAVARRAMALLDGALSDPERAPRAILGEATELGVHAATPVIAAAAVAAIAASRMQVGFLFAPRALNPKTQRLDPRESAKRLISAERGVEVLQSILKLGAIVTLSALAIGPLLRGADALIRMPSSSGVHFGAERIGSFALRAVALFVGFGLVDAAWARHAHRRRLRMGRREARRELEQAEGNPQLKAERRELARELLLTGPLSAVGRASVVVVNPIHFAVAIEGERGGARVLCKGRRERAAHIRSRAMRAGIPVLSDPPVARALHEVAVGDPIPESLVPAVAAILEVVAGATAAHSTRRVNSS